MSPIQSDSWKRNGFTLLWDAAAFTSISTLEQAMSLHAFFALDGRWEEEGISAHASVVVAGLDAMIDVLAESRSPEDAEAWIEKSLKPLVMRFQTAFEGQSALVFWLPRGRERFNHVSAKGWRWKLGAGQAGGDIALLRCLFAGAEQEVQRIETPKVPESFIGLHHRRIS